MIQVVVGSHPAGRDTNQGLGEIQTFGGVHLGVYLQSTLAPDVSNQYVSEEVCVLFSHQIEDPSV